MQNRYTGDIGDFGKLGLLRKLSSAGFRIGVNWYLTPDEAGLNNDGKFTAYLKSPAFRMCDPQLWEALGAIIKAGERDVHSLQQREILPATFYSSYMDFPVHSYDERNSMRQSWHKKAVSALEGCDIIFADPDNGLIVPSAVRGRKSVKYILSEELADYYATGASIVYYQHKARCKDEVYAAHHKQLLASGQFPDASGFGLKFSKTSQRFYFFLVHPQHWKRISEAIHAMLETPWKNYFSPLEMNL